MIELLAGAGILAAGWSAGFLHGRRKRRLTGPADLEICQCGHKSAYHDAAGCHQTVKGQILKYDDCDFPIKWERVECPCVRYVGPHTPYEPTLDGAAPPPSPIAPPETS